MGFVSLGVPGMPSAKSRHPFRPTMGFSSKEGGMSVSRRLLLFVSLAFFATLAGSAAWASVPRNVLAEDFTADW